MPVAVVASRLGQEVFLAQVEYWMTASYGGYFLFGLIDVAKGYSEEDLEEAEVKKENRTLLLLYYLASFALAVCGGLMVIFVWNGLADQVKEIFMNVSESLYPLLSAATFAMLCLIAFIGACDITSAYFKKLTSSPS
ncbi:hypothetical protein [Synechococcus sp. PCC 7335]|uniref:hypothetical protein n=1 Tax=Synechococcus sp. (strain ATCC 29403 / PCC 7335) TaxID=91464 RepID=UPI00030B6A28|nr:hypothetical protein [Synechococcus sp. PCC 7335]